MFQAAWSPRFDSGSALYLSSSLAGKLGPEEKKQVRHHVGCCTHERSLGIGNERRVEEVSMAALTIHIYNRSIKTVCVCVCSVCSVQFKNFIVRLKVTLKMEKSLFAHTALSLLKTVKH